MLHTLRTRTCKRKTLADRWAPKLRSRILTNGPSLTIDCSPLGSSGSATCTTTYPDGEPNTFTASVSDPVYSTNIESTLYSVIFTTAAGYSAATSATPSPTSPVPTVKSTTTPPPKHSSTTANPSLGPSFKVGIGLGVPLGACAFAGLALLLYRHGKHKERSRMSQMENLAPPSAFTTGSDTKRLSDAGLAGQTLGRQPPVYSMEMQGWFV